MNQALDSILELAVQLPALKRIGEEIGLSLDTELGRTTGQGSEKRRNKED